MEFDANIVGAAPNGLPAGIELAGAGWRVAIFEARSTIGGGTRTAELTLPGFLHDVCFAVHPLGIVSPFFKSFPLDDLGVHWIQPELPLAYPLTDGTAVALHRNVEQTAAGLDEDSSWYIRVFDKFVRRGNELIPELLALAHFPRSSFLLAAFGRYGLCSAESLAMSCFSADWARALFVGMVGHSI